VSLTDLQAGLAIGFVVGFVVGVVFAGAVVFWSMRSGK
jgi:hypothetical protein